jgi:predicted lipase
VKLCWHLVFCDVQLFYDNYTQALIGCRDIKTPDGTVALIAIVFRGSDQIKDWLDNLDFRMTRFLHTEHFPPFSRLKVHNGIYENVHDVEEKAKRIAFNNGLVKDSLTQILKDEFKRKQGFFRIIGHSLGGGMATLFVARLCEDYGIPSERILPHTFGAPPIGNRYFAAHFMETYITGVEALIDNLHWMRTQ